MSNEPKLIENYSLIRQPYRITMSMWNYSVWQKRILTKIISRLQRDITLLERGAEFCQLELFKSSDDDTVRLLPVIFNMSRMSSFRNNSVVTIYLVIGSCVL